MLPVVIFGLKYKIVRLYDFYHTLEFKSMLIGIILGFLFHIWK